MASAGAGFDSRRLHRGVMEMAQVVTYQLGARGTCCHVGCSELAVFRAQGTHRSLCLEHFRAWFWWYSRWMTDDEVEQYRAMWAQVADEPLPIREPRWRPAGPRQLAFPFLDT